jgi:hypothetical protein
MRGTVAVIRSFEWQSGREDTPDVEQAVIINLKLSNEDMGTPEDDGPIYELELQLEEAVEGSGAGEFEGDEWGGGYCRLFLYGADADRLFQTVLPVILPFDALPGSYLVRRFGDEGSPENVVRL